MATLCFVGLSTAQGDTAAEPSQPGILLSGSLRAPEASTSQEVDPLLPRGALRTPRERPNSSTTSICSLIHPVCVLSQGAASGSNPSSAEAQQQHLHLLEQAFQRYIAVLGLPPPRPDLGLGPSAALDLYLVADPENRQGRVFSDLRSSEEGRSSAFCTVDRETEATAWQAARCIIEASLIGANATSTPHFRESVSALIYTDLAVPTALHTTQRDDALANVHRAKIGRDAEASPAGWPWLQALGQRIFQRNTIAAAAVNHLARSPTPAGAVEWHNEPDSLDVLRHSLGSRAAVARALIDTAIQQAAASENTALHAKNTPLGPRYDWSILASSLPRRLAPKRPLEPLGATYLWLHLDRRTPRTELAFQAQWEPPAAFVWALLSLDANGRVLAIQHVPFLDGASSAERLVAHTANSTDIVVVGVNLGGVDLSHPFDPDWEPWEPHGFTVYLTELPAAESQTAGSEADG